MAEDKKETKIDDLKQEIIDLQKKVIGAAPEVKAPVKPYTQAEIAEHQKKGHIIGVAGQRLSEGHDEADLQKWDMVLCELGLKTVLIAEVGEKWSVPSYIIPMKIERGGKVGNDKAFQWENNRVNFRERGADNRIFFHLPAGALKIGQRYDCGYWAEINPKDPDATPGIHLLINECPRATGAPKK